MQTHRLLDVLLNRPIVLLTALIPVALGKLHKLKLQEVSIFIPMR